MKTLPKPPVVEKPKSSSKPPARRKKPEQLTFFDIWKDCPAVGPTLDLPFKPTEWRRK